MIPLDESTSLSNHPRRSILEFLGIGDFYPCLVWPSSAFLMFGNYEVNFFQKKEGHFSAFSNWFFYTRPYSSISPFSDSSPNFPLNEICVGEANPIAEKI